MKISITFPNDTEGFAFLEEMDRRYRLDNCVHVSVDVLDLECDEPHCMDHNSFVECPDCNVEIDIW